LTGSWFDGKLGTMKTTLDLPDELVRELKLRAVLQRRTVKDLVAETLRRGLGLQPPTGCSALAAGGPVEIAEDGLPVIRCRPGAPATRMTVDELLMLEQKAVATEDLQRAGLSV
jgi:plasmid stability protein